MVDFLSPDINKFEEQMISFIEAYYTILSEDKESFSTNIKIGSNDWWIKIKKLLKSFYNEDESKKGIKDWGYDKIFRGNRKIREKSRILYDNKYSSFFI